MKTSLVLSALSAFLTASVTAAPYGTASSSSSPSATAVEVPSPTASTGHKTGGEEYVVIFDSSKPQPPHVEEVLARLELDPNHPDVRYTFNNGAFRGFAASMKHHCLSQLANMTDISMVEKSVKLSTHATQIRSGAPWGLQRISSANTPTGDPTATDFTYSFEQQSSGLGAGVDIYVVDTGVNVEHVVFGGRAKMGFSFQTDASDGDGHGTHVAGTAAGSNFGVASGANVIGVKVLGADGSGLTSDTLAGMDYIIKQHNMRKNQPGFVGSIMSMSWGLDSVSQAIQQAISFAVQQGIHVSVAAGNTGADACEFSPSASGGSTGGAVTVGSIGIDDQISAFSNTGAPNVVNYLSGTSMACPHVTGVMAYLMAKDASLRSPGAMKAFLKSSALKGVVKGRALQGDLMLLVNNGVLEAQVPVARRGWSGLDRPLSVLAKLFGGDDEGKRKFLMARGEEMFQLRY
ncbi:hypothetical protein H2199_002618 [Coniosporium tulheliwenetii]|uniref:Uncharacterized protein n=1 Tax=Coniosporium tulheliwenetii TaxID=3383036 RepID=A0ACC2ZHG7_9PEZI|nr:hypothetical protein H2199_002618 [Cladosporium sp. JES 115]